MEIAALYGARVKEPREGLLATDNQRRLTDRSPRQAQAGAERRGVTKPPLLPPGVGAALARPPLDSGERKSLSQLQHPEPQHALSTKAGSRGQRKQAQRDTGRRKENVERDGASGRGSESERQGTRGPLDARPSGPAALGPWTGSRGHQKRDSAKSCPTRPGPQSSQPGRVEKNFPRGLLRSCPHPASVPRRRGGRDHGRGAALELRIVPAEHQSKFKTGLLHPHSLPSSRTGGKMLRRLQPGGGGPGAEGPQVWHPRRHRRPPLRCQAGAAVESASKSGRAGPAASALPGCSQALASKAPAAHLRTPFVTGSPNVTRSMTACLMWVIVSAN
ncbi:uncharacterized protein AAG666_009491 [Megaptera novaeangliae]